MSPRWPLYPRSVRVSAELTLSVCLHDYQCVQLCVVPLSLSWTLLLRECWMPAACILCITTCLA